MGQYEVYEFLKNNPDQWFSVNEIMGRLNLGKIVGANLRKLRSHGDVHFEFVTHYNGESNKRCYIYKYKEGNNDR